MLANLSACLPGVWMNYADMCYTPHFYAMSLAGAGRGKGIVTLGSILPDAVQRYLRGVFVKHHGCGKRHAVLRPHNGDLAVRRCLVGCAVFKSYHR